MKVLQTLRLINHKVYKRTLSITTINHFRFLKINVPLNSDKRKQSNLSNVIKYNFCSNIKNKDSHSFEKVEKTMKNYLFKLESVANDWSFIQVVKSFIQFYNGTEEFFNSQSIHLYRKNIRSLEIVLDVIYQIDNTFKKKFAHFNIDHQYYFRKKNVVPVVNDLAKILDRISVYYKEYLEENISIIKKKDSSSNIENILYPIFFFVDKTSTMFIPLLRNEINQVEFHDLNKFYEFNRYLFDNIYIKHFKIFPSNYKFFLLYSALEYKELEQEKESIMKEIFKSILLSSDRETFIKILKAIEINNPNSIIKHRIYDSILQYCYKKFSDIKKEMTPNEIIQSLIFFVIFNKDLVNKDLDSIDSSFFGPNYEYVKQNESFLLLIFALLRQLYERQMNQHLFVKDFCMNFFLNHSQYEDHLSKFKNKVNLTRSLLFLTDYNLTDQDKMKLIEHAKKNIQYLLYCSEFNKENLLKSFILLDIFDNDIYYELLTKIINVDFKHINRSNFYDLSFVVLNLKLIKLPQIVDLNKQIITLVDQIENNLISSINPNFLFNNKESFFERSLKNYLDQFNLKLDKNHIPHKLLLSYSDFYSQEKNLIIELDGPFHFIKDNKNYIYNQTSFLKKEILKKLGYNLISIPFFEWQDLINSEEKIKYLKDKFAPFNIVLKQ